MKTKTLLLTAVFLLLAASNATAGNVCRANIAVLKGGQPALTAAKVTIYNQRTGLLVTSTINHQFSTELDCGISYRATAELNGAIQERRFDAQVSAGAETVVNTITFNFQ